MSVYTNQQWPLKLFDLHSSWVTIGKIKTKEINGTKKEQQLKEKSKELCVAKLDVKNWYRSANVCEDDYIDIYGDTVNNFDNSQPQKKQIISS